MDQATKESVVYAVETTVEAAEEAIQHPYIKKLSRLGFFTKGFLFIVIGILAILVALGDRKGELADPKGALTTIALAPFGKAVLIIFTVGAFGHGFWNILRGVADIDNAGNGWRGISQRVIAAGTGIFYLMLSWSAWNIITAAQVEFENGAMQRTLTAFLFALPLGFVLVFFIGLGVIIAGIHECYSGISGKFQESFRLWEISGASRRLIIILGILSFTARALIFALMGWFFISAAINYNPNEAIGVDGALLLLAQSRFGKTILFITATGLLCHGILSLYEAKYRRIC